MKLIIDIPEEIYQMVMNTGIFGKYKFNTANAIKKGVPFDSVIEDIKAEIKNKKVKSGTIAHKVAYGNCLEIIDKHISGKAESEE